MSTVSLETARGRAGHMICACDSDVAGDAREGRGDVADQPWGVAAGFALTVLTQALTAAVLPLAGLIIAPARGWATFPYALMLVGATAATVPAAALTDLYGRRAVLALGGSLGVAGACLAVWGFVALQFFALGLGSFWLGVAQGFGLFFRHAGALAATDKPRAVATVLGAGTLAAVAAPGAIGLAQAFSAPLAPATILIVVAAAQLLVLCLSVTPPPVARLRAGTSAARIGMRPFVLATAAAASSWFGMALMMAGAPLMMATCGIGRSIGAAAIGWHILWMYAPAAALQPWLRRTGPSRCIAVGMMLLIAAGLAVPAATTTLAFGAVLAAAGCGWSLTMLGSSIVLHTTGRPSSWLLALHDSCLLAGAVGGAAAAAWLV